MSKTPICDRWEYDSYSGGLVVPLNVAKDLEIELAEARAEIERKDKLIEQMRDALKALNLRLALLKPVLKVEDMLK
jgi:HPt (histidine-containing phosphotransfer) domain-containing protein